MAVNAKVGIGGRSTFFSDDPMMNQLLAAYIAPTIILLVLSATIGSEEKVDLKHIMIAAFGWPVVAPVLAWRAWVAR
jgi:hypothetical protein